MSVPNHTFSQLKSMDYSELLETLKKTHAKPELYLFNLLIHKAPTYEIALLWLEQMPMKPDEASYIHIIKHAPDYAIVLRWMAKMEEEKITLKAEVYNRLIYLSPDHETALDWFGKMKEKNLEIDERKAKARLFRGKHQPMDLDIY